MSFSSTKKTVLCFTVFASPPWDLVSQTGAGAELEAGVEHQMSWPSPTSTNLSKPQIILVH